MALAARDRTADLGLGARFAGLCLLHSGSRFTVYQGREIALDRSVVVKVPDIAGSSWLSDVIDHEATVLETIGTHPNIVRLYERFTLEDGRQALLLEHCSNSLAGELAGGGFLPVRDVVTIGIKLAGALDRAHQAGFVHCDVRPNNVLVSERAEPVLAGFAESVQPGADIANASHVTTAHTAPELFEGRPPTPAADVYGLASTLYELIAGRAAFRAYAGESPAQVAARVLNDRVKPIVAPGIPLEMSDLLTWAMSPDPRLRPPTPSWIAEELRRIGQREGWARTVSG